MEPENNNSKIAYYYVWEIGFSGRFIEKTRLLSFFVISFFTSSLFHTLPLRLFSFPTYFCHLFRFRSPLEKKKMKKDKFLDAIFYYLKKTISIYIFCLLSCYFNFVFPLFVFFIPNSPSPKKKHASRTSFVLTPKPRGDKSQFNLRYNFLFFLPHALIASPSFPHFYSLRYTLTPLKENKKYAEKTHASQHTYLPAAGESVLCLNERIWRVGHCSPGKKDVPTSLFFSFFMPSVLFFLFP